MIDPRDLFQLDLPLVWIVEVPGVLGAADAPLIANDEVVIRFQDSVGSHALTDGTPGWRQKIVEKASLAVRLLARGDLFITDHARPPDRTISFAAVRRGGPVVWRVDTGGVILRASVALCGDDLLVVSGGKAEGKTLRIIETADGRVRTNVPLWEGATTARSIGDSIFVSSSADGTGLVRIAPTGQQVLAPAAVHRMIGARDGFALVTEAGALELRDRTGAIRWSVPATGELAIDAGDVLGFDGDPSGPQPVLRSETDGAEIWRASALPSQPLGAHLCGPLAMVRFDDGMRIYDRATGALVTAGEGRFSHGVALVGRDVVIGCSTFLVRAALP
jgi:hypothetical protein